MKKTIHEKISDYRKLKGLTQEQLGSILSVSGQAVSKWEKGESMPDIMILSELCKTFGISVDTLLDVPYMENKENIIKETACFAKDYGREKVLHDIMSLTFNDVENRIEKAHTYSGEAVGMRLVRLHILRQTLFLRK